MAYRLWGLVGILVILLGYPIVVVAYAIRFQTRGLFRTSRRLGLLGITILMVFLWGMLWAGAYFRDFPAEGLVALGAGGVVATVSSGLSYLFARYGGRGSTIFLAAPLAVTALFLPPVVAALYSPLLATRVFPGSETLAIWLLDNPLSVGGLNSFLRAKFDLLGVAYVGMWFGLAIPTGWVLGVFVLIADIVRPQSESSA